eukprot:3601615-Prorocentrum_lima.AAC.1
MTSSLVGSEMCIRDRPGAMPMTTTINFMCEKHGKGRVDALFAWASQAKKKEAKKQMLVTLQDL